MLFPPALPPRPATASATRVGRVWARRRIGRSYRRASSRLFLRAGLPFLLGQFHFLGLGAGRRDAPGRGVGVGDLQVQLPFFLQRLERRAGQFQLQRVLPGDDRLFEFLDQPRLFAYFFRFFAAFRFGAGRRPAGFAFLRGNAFGDHVARAVEGDFDDDDASAFAAADPRHQFEPVRRDAFLAGIAHLAGGAGGKRRIGTPFDRVHESVDDRFSFFSFEGDRGPPAEGSPMLPVGG